jgi:erythromycin esterase-like protein
LILFQIVYRRLVAALRRPSNRRAIAHRLCRLIWLILRQGVRYEERGPSVSQRSQSQRTRKMIRQLQKLGYRVEPLSRCTKRSSTGAVIFDTAW